MYYRIQFSHYIGKNLYKSNSMFCDRKTMELMKEELIESGIPEKTIRFQCSEDGVTWYFCL